MGLGFKYHVATIMAIFFALAVGILIGDVFGTSPQVAAQQAHALQGLQKTIAAEQVTAMHSLETYHKFSEWALPLVLHGRLSGVRAAILQVGDYPDATGLAQEALQKAGATVASTTIVDPSFARPDDLLQSDLSTARASDPTLPSNRAGLAAAVAGALAHGDAQANTIASLQQAGFLHPQDDSEYQAPVKLVILVAGRRVEQRDRVTNVDAPLITAMQADGLTVIGCEPSGAVISDVPAYRDLGLRLATVDDIDTVYGQCALVFARDADPDDYGTTESARALLPPVESKQ